MSSDVISTLVNRLNGGPSSDGYVDLTDGNNFVQLTADGSTPSIIIFGLWESTPVGLQYGGTNAALTASNGGIFYSTGSAGAILSGTATANQIVMSGSSSAPSWSTATYPATTTINQILYSSSANVITGLATANNGVLLTNGSGVPSIGNATVPVGGTGNTTFTAYSVICAGTTATGAFQNVVGLGSSGQVLTSAGAGALPAWQTAASGTVTSVSGTALQIDVATGTTTPVISIDAGYVGQTSITTLGTIGTGTWAGTNIALNHGGTNAALTASNGGIFYSTASAGAILSGTATAGQLLLSGASTAPTWSTSTYPSTNAINTILYASSANVMAALATANNGVLLTSGSGVPSIGTATVAVGGTGNTTFTAYSVICAGTTATGVFQNVSGLGSAGQVLTSAGAGALPTWSNPTDGVIVNQNSSSVTMVAGSRYYINNGASLVTATLPGTAAQGDIFIIVGGSSGGWKVGQAAGQTIHFDTTPTTAGTGGSLASTSQYNCIEIHCITANTTFVVVDSVGSITVV